MNRVLALWEENATLFPRIVAFGRGSQPENQWVLSDCTPSPRRMENWGVGVRISKWGFFWDGEEGGKTSHPPLGSDMRVVGLESPFGRGLPQHPP